MKKTIAFLLICSLLFTLAIAFTSCDYQAEVDSVRTELMEGAKDLLDPFLNRAESHTESSTESSIESSTESSIESSADEEAPVDSGVDA